jgi:hypothetical protein
MTDENTDPLPGLTGGGGREGVGCEVVSPGLFMDLAAVWRS